jgi:hypothetical protein
VSCSYGEEAKALELHAAMSLSRLWQQQGKRAEAHELLTPLYGWFGSPYKSVGCRILQVNVSKSV